MWVAIKEYIFLILQYLYGITGDYGWAIIILTVSFRLVMVPLTIKQTKSMAEMQRIQPKIKELQKKYKNDKEKLQEETLKFYQENKVNPFGGCLPIVLQMPIFLALFQVLSNRVSETAAHPETWNLAKYIETLPASGQTAAKAFWIIIPDITATPAAMYAAHGLVSALPYIILAILFGVSIWLPQQLMPGEQQQKNTALIMAVMMVYFGWVSPAGVLLYWVTSSVIGLIQQQLTLKHYAQKEGA